MRSVLETRSHVWAVKHRRPITWLGTFLNLYVLMNAIKMIEEGKVDVTPWVTHTCAFDDFEDNFAKWTDPANGVIKALVLMDE